MPDAPDAIDQLMEGSDASDQPAGNTANINLDEIVSKVAAAVQEQSDKRFQGFQSLMDKKLADIADQFKAAGLSPEEREQLEAQSSDDEVAKIRRENEIFRMRDRFPKGVDALLKLMSAESLEDQLTLMESLTPAEAAQVEEAAAAAAGESGGEGEADQTPVPEVDRNNPSRSPRAGALSAGYAGGGMTDELADAILSQAGKGAMMSSREQQTE